MNSYRCHNAAPQMQGQNESRGEAKEMGILLEAKVKTGIVKENERT